MYLLYFEENFSKVLRYTCQLCKDKGCEKIISMKSDAGTQQLITHARNNHANRYVVIFLLYFIRVFKILT